MERDNNLTYWGNNHLETLLAHYGERQQSHLLGQQPPRDIAGTLRRETAHLTYWGNNHLETLLAH